MVIQRRYLLAVLAVLIGAWAAWWLLRDRIEERILKQMDRVEEACALNRALPPIAAAAQAREIGLFFTADAAVNAGGMDVRLQGRKEISSLAFQAFSQCDYLELSFSDRDVQVADDRLHAELRCIAVASIRARGDRERRREALVLKWVLDEGDTWRIAALAPVETIRHPLSP